MRTKICEQNIERIESDLAEVNGDAHDHCYTTYKEILALVKIAEQKMAERLLVKSESMGLVFRSTSGLPVPNSYRYKRKATRVELTFNRVDWYITAICEDYVYREGGRSRIFLSESQKEYAIQKFKRFLED